jgi:hypothetical protein
MKRLLRLYPRAWRDRYGEEMGAVLEGMSFDPRAVLDLVRCAADAHLHPPGGRRATISRGAQVALLVLGGSVGLPLLNLVLINVYSRVPSLDVAINTFFGVGVLILAALASRLAGWRLGAWFCCLLALQLTLTSGLLAQIGYEVRAPLEPVRSAVASFWHPGWLRLLVPFSLVLVVLPGAGVAALLRSRGIGWPLALAIGCALVASVDLVLLTEPYVYPLVAPLPRPTWFRLLWLWDGAQLAAWGALAAALVRRSGFGWRSGFALGCALALLVAFGYSPADLIARAAGFQDLLSGYGQWLARVGWWTVWFSPTTYVWELPTMLWAAILAMLVTSDEAPAAEIAAVPA